MLTLLAYLHYASRPFSLARYLGVIGLFALGLMSKPTLVTLPLLLLLLDYWPLGRMNVTKPRSSIAPSPARSSLAISDAAGFSLATEARSTIAALWRLILEKVPLLLLTAGSCALTLWAPGKENTFLSTELVPLWSRIANAPVSYAAYLGQFFCPAGLAVIYPWQDVDLPPWKVAGAVSVLAAVTAAAVVCRRKRPYFLVGWLWCLGMLVPVIGLVQVGQQARADRFTYLPQIGLCIAVIWWLSDSCPSWPSRRWAYGAAATCALALLMAWAWRQASFWSDSSALWNRDLACTSHNSIAHLGYAKADFGRADEAIAHYRKVLEVHSAFPALDLFYDAEAYKNLGVVLADRRQFAEAVAYYQKALAINANDAEAYYNMGVALAACGQTDEAIAHYQRAVEIKADYAVAHNNLGLALASRERLDEAMVQFQQALEIDPSYADAHNNLGNVLLNRGRIDQATVQYRTALELKPDYAEAHFNLGLALTDRGRTEEATEHYQQALILATQQNKPALVEKLKAQRRPFRNDKIQ
jgi:tetratricopeptide (TPR) repeat protein